MKTEKMSFKNIKDVLSRDEMKSIMAGSGPAVDCSYTIQGYGTYSGSCADSNPSTCELYCRNAGWSDCNCYPV